MIAIAFLAVAMLQQSSPSTSESASNSPSDSTDAALEMAVSPVDLSSTFVGRQVCSECHEDNFHMHGKSGHASTFVSTRDSDVAKKFVGKTLDAGEPYGLLTYSMDENGLRVARVDDPSDQSFPLQYALGSGHNAVTFFSLISDAADDTIGIEHRVSWFASDDHFGLTPGQIGTSSTTLANCFGNSVHDEHMRACVDCHTTSANIVDQNIVDLIPNVNCEKCHGPGGEHVRQARLSNNPPPFSVGRDDWNAESELQLCGECHRLPIDFPPKQLREYPALMARFQPVGMLRSKCYLESSGQFQCTTCHNPHQASTAKSMEAYVNDCVQCHQENTSDHVVCPVSPQEGCIECHMPPMRFEQGMTFHDHYIRVHPED
ncbi:Doubled CXXCH motif (Paired_CXXCH_1) [Rubripirellula lacrimiformis]|uniref:Doubled CXXCH motif (Paired_CXXCH_1) n=2 Tax=Rubripirellula lacrimiformis TaxID=1930273 RepID=A0A517N4C5_9BACT|nr:Doubled CXXCH motif (Paired_CXXCH_1) [Rubripirellula lacrimiformis]